MSDTRILSERAEQAAGNEPKEPDYGSLELVHSILAQLEEATASDQPIIARSLRIEAARSVLPSLSDDPHKTELLEKLATALYDQSQAVDSLDLLDESLDYLAQALEATDIKQDYARLAIVYSGYVAQRYVRSRNPADIENALGFAGSSINLIKELHNEDEKASLLAQALPNQWLCMFLQVEFSDLDDADYEEALEGLMASAVEADQLISGLDDADKDALALAKTNLGKTHEMKWERHGRGPASYDDLVVGLTLAREAVLLTPETDAGNQHANLTNLALRLQKAYLAYVQFKLLPDGIIHGVELLDESLELLAKATALPIGNVLDGPSNVLAFVLFIRQFPPQHRGEMLGRCEHLLRDSTATVKGLWASSSVDDQRDIVATFYGLSRYAAAAAIQKGRDAFDALLLLESGRALGQAVVNQETLDLATVDLAASDLAKRYIAAKEALRDALMTRAPYHLRRTRMQDFDELRAELDSVPGVIRPPDVLTREEVLSLADGRDVVAINLTDIRSDAIIVSKGKIFSIELPGIDEEDLSERSWEIQTRLAKDKEQEEYFAELHQNLLALFALLWRNLVRPVLERLGHTGSLSASDAWPHVCWVPSGVLCIYPIHAAGLGLHKQSNTINRVVSAYASSMTSLRSLQRHARSDLLDLTKSDGQVCVVASPKTPDRAPLELSTEEIQAVRGAFPQATILSGQTTQAVLDALATEAGWVHFSCHGEVDYDRPPQSQLLTADWMTDPLTVSRIQLLRLRRGPRLAYLSACFTANAGVENQQDEGVHLASALQLAGIPLVAGAAWYVGEEASLAVVRRFYARLSPALSDVAGNTGLSKAVAEALHFAIRDFAESTRSAANRCRGDPVSWAPFMLFGT